MARHDRRDRRRRGGRRDLQRQHGGHLPVRLLERSGQHDGRRRQSRHGELRARGRHGARARRPHGLPPALPGLARGQLPARREADPSRGFHPADHAGQVGREGRTSSRAAPLSRQVRWGGAAARPPLPLLLAALIQLHASATFAGQTDSGSFRWQAKTPHYEGLPPQALARGPAPRGLVPLGGWAYTEGAPGLCDGAVRASVPWPPDQAEQGAIHAEHVSAGCPPLEATHRRRLRACHRGALCPVGATSLGVSLVCGSGCGGVACRQSARASQGLVLAELARADPGEMTQLSPRPPAPARTPRP